MITNGNGTPPPPTGLHLKDATQTLVVPIEHPKVGRINAEFDWRQIKVWAAQIILHEAQLETEVAQPASKIVIPSMMMPKLPPR